MTFPNAIPTGQVFTVPGPYRTAKGAVVRGKQIIVCGPFSVSGTLRIMDGGMFVVIKREGLGLVIDGGQVITEGDGQVVEIDVTPADLTNYYTKLEADAAIASAIESIPAPDWSNISDKPETFPPAEHDHNELKSEFFTSYTVSNNSWYRIASTNEGNATFDIYESDYEHSITRFSVAIPINSPNATEKPVITIHHATNPNAHLSAVRVLYRYLDDTSSFIKFVEIQVATEYDVHLNIRMYDCKSNSFSFDYDETTGADVGAISKFSLYKNVSITTDIPTYYQNETLNIITTGVQTNTKMMQEGYEVLDARYTPPADVTDHGALSGLSDDDHTQYHNDARGDLRYANKTHSHSIADLPVATLGQSDISKLCRSDDYRLSNARTPTAHIHLIADLPVATSGVSDSKKLCRSDDARLSNARTPTSHTHLIADLPVAASGVSDSTKLCSSDDARLSNARTPTSHTHTFSWTLANIRNTYWYSGGSTYVTSTYQFGNLIFLSGIAYVSAGMTSAAGSWFCVTQYPPIADLYFPCASRVGGVYKTTTVKLTSAGYLHHMDNTFNNGDWISLGGIVYSNG